MKYIDLETWKRRAHFAFFYRMDYPQFNICFNLDVTQFLIFTKKNNLSFYYAMIHAVTTVVNETEDFRYRIRDGKVLLHKKIHPSFTDMASNDDLFKMVTVDLKDDIFEFVKLAKETSEKQKDYFNLDKLAGRDDLIYITCIPWISFTHLSHTITINKNDSVPKISWGKYFTDGDKVLLPFSIQVHHALMDGVHVGKYVEKLQKYLDQN
jgi:chloramphenicol O-acetyltransferase type A